MQKGEKNSRIFGWTTFLSVVVTLALVLSGPIAYAQKPVDLNTASEKELEAIKGVGPATAKKIIAARPYKSVDELSKAGLSAKQVDAVKPFVTVGSASPAPAAPASTGKVAPAAPSKEAPAKAAATVVPAKPAAPPVKAAEKPSKPTMKLAPGQKVNINTATKEELDALPGIGPVKAQAIIEGRPYQKPEDIMKVKGIKQGEFNKIKDIIIVK
ncbi:MAG TPA: helix-hairpin-helix domain-containing protein [Thermodesulfobacteriota bacterium]|nr:helix-hairpin-helix domain-containing protein [Thermodesulfobacteriota bacterium]